MIYLACRLITNANEWLKPSPGRLGSKGEGEYVQDNGFGWEDWNFNVGHSIDGYVYGYSYYRPAEHKKKENFNFAFMTYDDHRWNLVGFYFNAQFVEEGAAELMTKPILKQRMDDLRSLGHSLGKDWATLSDADFLAKLGEESQWLMWRVARKDVRPAPVPIPLIKDIYSSGNYRITRPKEIDKKLFGKLESLFFKDISEEQSDENTDFAEGKLAEKRHRSRERNSKVILLAKERFIDKYGMLFCEVCEFDFEKRYGEVGREFIEGHHTIPVSDLKSNSTTSVNDIALVCSNCHRMLHRRRPWLTMGQLKDLIVDEQ